MDQLTPRAPEVASKDAYDRFLDAIALQGRLPDHVSPATAASVTMCTLVTRLTPGQAHQLLMAFPPTIQALFQPCVAHRHGAVAMLDDAGFLQRIAERLDLAPAHAELLADCVFRAARAQLPLAMIEHVARQLPRDLRDLWLGTRMIAPGAATERGARLELLVEIAERAPLPTGISASDALSAVMCTFSQRLSGGEAHDVLLGLPGEVRSLLQRCITHRDEEGAVFDRAQLFGSVAADLGVPSLLAEEIVLIVLAAVKRSLPVKEVRDVASQLPPDLEALWAAA
jgi:uncharacterized protein (DUF2267 family)